MTTDEPPNDADAASAETEAAGASTPSPPPPLRPGWRDLWQLPALVGGLALLGLALATWIRDAPPPDFHAALDDVERLIEDDRFDEAIGVLNDPIGANLARPEADRAVRARFHALTADALYLAQQARELDVLENHRKIAAHYIEAREEHLAELAGPQIGRLADALVSLGETDAAIDELGGLGADDVERRFAVIRRLAALYRAGDQRAPTYQQVMDLLTDLRADPAASVEARRWTVARQTELRLEAGYPEQALRRLLPEIQQLPSRTGPDAGELFVLLGLAYLELGDEDDARVHLEHARGLVPAGDELAGRASVGLGRIALRRNAPEEALDDFADAAAAFPRTRVGQTAWFGVARAEAAMGDVDASIDAYTRVIDLLPRVPDPPVTPGAIDDDLGLRHDERAARDDPQGALRFATLALRLGPPGRPTSRAIGRVARAHRRVGDALLGRTGVDPSSPEALLLGGTDPVTLEEARAHYLQAARWFERHAEAILVPDAEGSAESLWLAADSNDLAGEPKAAALLFERYAVEADASPRRVEARYRMARARDALGDCTSAAAIYEEIISNHPESLYAQRAYLPLVRCLIGAGDEDSIGRAEALLHRMVGGALFDPAAPEFIEARIELGALYLRSDRPELAVAAVEEVLERAPERRSDPSLLFQLADAYRRSAARLARDLASSQPGRRAERLALRRDRLESARDAFGEVRAMLDGVDPRRRTPFDVQALRDAVLHRADAQTELARMAKSAGSPGWEDAYVEAIVMYDEAAQTYRTHPSSLLAMVQIVNCYAEMERWREAETAHRRAKARLDALPADAWNAPDLPMGREHWERWLASSIRLDRMADAEAPPG